MQIELHFNQEREKQRIIELAQKILLQTENIDLEEVFEVLDSDIFVGMKFYQMFQI